MKAYEEYLKFITSAPSLEEIIEFRPTDATLGRAKYLSHMDRDGLLSKEEKTELTEYRKAERFVSNLKIRAERRLTAVT